MSISFHISDTSLSFSLSPLLLFSLLCILLNAFFTCLFLVVFPTLKFVFITQVFLQRLACLICCLFISLLLAFSLSLSCSLCHSVFIFIFICEMSGKARLAWGCRSVICRHRRLPRLLRLCRRLFRPFARLGSWLWLFLVRVICFAYYSRPSRLNSAPVGLCALLFLRFGTCNMQISAAFCFCFCFVSELKQSEAPASSQTAQDPKLCATRNRNQMRALIVVVVVVVVRLVVCAGMWPDPAVASSRSP